MRTEAYMNPYLELGFDEGDVALLTELVFDEEIASLLYNEKTEGRLLEGLEIFGEDDDHYRSAFIYYVKHMGQHFLPELTTYFLDRDQNIFNRMVVLEGVEKCMKHTENQIMKEAWEEALVTYLENEEEQHDALNAFAIFALVDVSQAKHIDLIRNVFRSKPVDLWYNCDLEMISRTMPMRRNCRFSS